MTYKLKAKSSDVTKVNVIISSSTYSAEYIEVEVENSSINPVYRLRRFIEEALKKNELEGN